MPAKPRLFGRAIQRMEDRALVAGNGCYLDDLQPENCLAAAFVRSTHAHASFSNVDLSAALAMPGVVAAFAAGELKKRLVSNFLSTGLPSASFHLQADRPVLADGEVAYVGEPIAIVIAASRSLAEDAVEAVAIDFKPLPPVVDCREAFKADSPTAHSSLPHNRIADFGFGYGDIEAAFSAARHRVHECYKVHRGGSHSMEGRGVLAVPDRLSERLSVWSSTQTPQALKQMLCDLLGLHEGEIAVFTPDVGGGFGPKLVTYPEEIAVAASALIVQRAIKWVEDRREHFLSTTQERDQYWDVELALDADGAILGIRGKLIHDHGAYNVRGLNVPYGSGVSLPLAYNVPAYRLDIAVALTNKVPVTPIRGAGQPQAAFVMERLLDRAAAVTGLGRDEIRLRNLVRADQMPCEKPLKLRGGTNVILDSGNYPATQQRAMALADWAGFPARRKMARQNGQRIGLGLVNYVEGTGRGPYEVAAVRVDRSGEIVVTTGASAMGQGTATMIAQIVGEQLGGDMSKITVRTGNAEGSLGFGGFNSRQTVMAGASAHASAVIVRRKLLKVASHLLEADENDLDVVGDNVVVKGVPELRRSFAELARAAAGVPGFKLPGIDSPGLEASEKVIIDDMTYSNGSALAEVEVDEETGAVRVLRFAIAHDCGRMVNPLMVDGQVIGGVAHGLGNALFEQMIYDDLAQPMTTTLADYLLVSTAEMPPVDILHLESPSRTNPLGVKGVGESGVIPVAGAIMSAIDDALSDLGVHIDRAPISPQMLLKCISEARGCRKFNERRGELDGEGMQ